MLKWVIFMYDPVYELEHYGVLGMKWGVRKNPEVAYAKAGKKLSKLDTKVSKLNAKAAKKEQKAVKKQRKASSAILFKKHKAKVASKATQKVLKKYQKAQEKQIKAFRWNESMKKAFANTKVKNANKEYVNLGKKYSQMSIDSIMSNNTSVNSIMQIEDYYRRRSQK